MMLSTLPEDSTPVKPAGQMFEHVEPHTLVWRHHPNGGTIAVVAVPLEEGVAFHHRGFVRIEGHRAVIHSRLPDEVHNAAFRICFDRPFPYPHP